MAQAEEKLSHILASLQRDLFGVAAVDGTVVYVKHSLAELAKAPLHYHTQVIEASAEDMQRGGVSSNSLIDTAHNHPPSYFSETGCGDQTEVRRKRLAIDTGLIKLM